MSNKAFTFGRLLVTTAMQGGCAPLVDKCRTESVDGRVFIGVLILLTPWRRNRYRESLPQRGLVFGWQSHLSPRGISSNG